MAGYDLSTVTRSWRDGHVGSRLAPTMQWLQLVGCRQLPEPFIPCGKQGSNLSSFASSPAGAGLSGLKMLNWCWLTRS